MKICLIDNAIQEYSSDNYNYKGIVDDLIKTEEFSEIFEFREAFFDELKENGEDEEIIKSLLTKYDAIMYHSTQFSGAMDSFYDPNEEANENRCKFIGFSGGRYDPIIESDSSIIIHRDVLYNNLKECIKNAKENGEIDLNIFLKL